MKISDTSKGIIYSLLAALAVSNVYIFSKAALNEIHLAQFGVYWFGLGIFWLVIYLIIRGKLKQILKIKKSTFKNLLLLGGLEMFGTLFFFLAIKTVTNPAVVSFLANINPLFVTAMGILFLKERFNYIEFTGMGILLAGTFIISAKGSTDVGTIFIPGVQYVIFSGLIYSVAVIVAKKQVKNVDASILALSRIIMLFIFSLLSLFYLGLDFDISKIALINLTIGSFLGPFLTATFGYLALKYMEASKTAMVRSVRSLFVLTGSFIYFGSLPTMWQIIGGLFTITGVIILSLGRLKIKKSS